jgi:hypothetical protein
MQRNFILKPKAKRIFNVNNKVDCDLFKKFLVSGGWGSKGCPFVLEEPFTNIPYMIQTKIVAKALKIN